MSKLPLPCLIFVMGCLLVPAQALAAATMTDVYVALWAMRGVGNGMGQAQGLEAKEFMMKELIKYSAKITETLAEAEKNPQNNAETKARLSEFKIAWIEFQKIRDENVFPAIRAGDNQKVRQEMAVQNGRFRRMTLLVQPRNPPAATPATPATVSRTINIQTGPGPVGAGPDKIAPAKEDLTKTPAASDSKPK